MMFFSRKTRRDARLRSTRRSSQLRLEQLESRLVLSTFTVGNLSDSGPGSLRQEILDANSQDGDDIINFSVTGTINLTGALPDLSSNVQIQGPGAASLTVRRDTGGNYRVFTVDNGSTVVLNGLTISNGVVLGGGGGGIANEGCTLTVSNCTLSGNHADYSGGGIDNEMGTLTVSNCTLSGNSANGGAGIANTGTFNGLTGITSWATMTISNSTVSGNSAGNNGYGGGIDNSLGRLTVSNCTLSGDYASVGGGIANFYSTLTVSNCTLSDNSASYFGGGIYNGGGDSFHNGGGALTVSNSTLSGNYADNNGGGILNDEGNFLSGLGTLTLNNTIVANSTSGGDVAGPSAGNHNLIEDGSGGVPDTITGDPMLGPLASYGGPTQTMALLPGSPAIDAGDNALIPSGVMTDQRGLPRVVNTTMDIGAFESSGFTIAVCSGSGQSTGVLTAFPAPLVATVTANNPLEPVVGGLVTFTPQASGASANLSGSPATIDASGTASVSATANGIVGSYTVTATASGIATPASFSLTNISPYTSGGFLQPISLNRAFKQGSTVPIKWQVRDAGGNLVTSLSVITGLTVTGPGGTTTLYPGNNSSSGAAALSNDGSQYIYNWQTKGFALGSYTITANLLGGSSVTQTIMLSTSGSAASLVIDGVTGSTAVGALLAGDMTLYVDNTNSAFSDDELARIREAAAGIEALVSPYGANIIQVDASTGMDANIVVNASDTSVVGGMADGVLGCTSDAGLVTLIQGWNWYTGTDPTAVGPGQFDFETVVMHELGHALGLGHSALATSVMFPTLAPGSANRSLTVADLNVPDADGGGASGLHARVYRPAPPPAPATAPTLNQNVGLMVWDLAVADMSWTSLTRTQRKPT